MIKECIDDEKTPKEIIIEVKDSCAKNNISEQDAVVMVNIFLVHAFDNRWRWCCGRFHFRQLTLEQGYRVTFKPGFLVRKFHKKG